MTALVHQNQLLGIVSGIRERFNKGEREERQNISLEGDVVVS